MERTLAGILVVVCLAGTLSGQSGDNILLVVADDFGVDKVGVYGENPSAPPTPNLDALAGRGVLFRNAWANTYCSSTRAVLHTGRYSMRTFVGSWIPAGSGQQLPLDEITLPELLDRGESGYRHALIGKWHLGTTAGPATPNRSGWSHFAGLLEGSLHYYKWQRTENGASQTIRRYITTQNVDDALAWIQQQNGPWLCVVSLYAPHWPVHTPPARLHTRQLPSLPPELAPVQFFAAVVEAMDKELGRLFAGLGPELARTNVLFTSDNGTDNRCINGPFHPQHGKGTAYEGGVRVPLIVAGPAVSDPQREVPHLVSLADLFATVGALAGVEMGDAVPSWVPLDSVSLLPYLQDPEQPPMRDVLYSEYFQGTDWSVVHRSGFAAVRDVRHKLIRRYSAGGPGVDSGFVDEFYDLAQDPQERRDLMVTGLSGDAADSYRRLCQHLLRIRTQEAELRILGAATCRGSGGVPTLVASGTPRLGGRYRVGLRGAPPASVALFASGRSSFSWGATALPLELSTGDGWHCRLMASMEVVQPVLVDGSGSANVEVAVPVDLSLVGKTVFHTWAIRDPEAPANPVGVIATQSAVAVLGS